MKRKLIPLPKRNLPPNIDEENRVNNENAQEDDDRTRRILRRQAEESPERRYNEEEINRQRRKEEIQRLIQEEEKHKEVTDIPDFIKNLHNEQSLMAYLRMKKRNLTEGAIDFQIENDDLATENIELYDNKCINIEPPKVHEDKDQVPKFYIESLSRNRFYSLKYDPDRIKDEDASISTQAPSEVEKPTIKGKTSDEIKLDDILEDEVSKTILAISNNISIFFLFAQGLLAGLALANIMFLYSFSNYSEFIFVFSNSIEIYYNLIHFLTFGSIIGNGNKFVTMYRYKKIYQEKYSSGTSLSIIKRKLIIIGIAFVLLIIAFILLLVMASYIPKLFYSNFTFNSLALITEDEFFSFKVLSLIFDIIVILNFMINIFDISRVNDINYELQRS